MRTRYEIEETGAYLGAREPLVGAVRAKPTHRNWRGKALADSIPVPRT
jgi:hypothetical protein